MRRGLGLTLTHLLLEDGIIKEEDAQKIERVQQREGGRLEDIILNLGLAEADRILSYSSYILGIVPLHLDGFNIPEHVLKIIPVEMAAKYQFIPISHVMNLLTVAMAAPWNIYTIESIERETNLSVSPVYSSWKDIQNAIRKYYLSSEDMLGDYLEKMQQNEMLEALPDKRDEESQNIDKLEKQAQESSVVGLTDLILLQAIENGASDIHIEPYRGQTRVRYRVDGVLEEVNTSNKQLLPVVVSRIKIMSNIDIAERRKAQDGRMMFRTSSGKVNIRVSTMPTVSGEKVVMRIFDDSQNMLKLNQLGMSQDLLERYIQSIKNPNGIILVTGPTGSGKTTTLYASLNMVNNPDVNVVTIEDPVEHVSEEYAQVEVNQKAGRTFASVLRSILRQDPDIIMVGEIRDFETAELAIRASLTGHLVFSTLHTNDASSAVVRLFDLQVESFLISATLSVVVAQRLVRLLCTNCKKPYKPPKELINKLDLPPGDYTFFQEQGCHLCGGKGYKGRIGVYEVIFMDDEIRELIHLKKGIAELREAAIKNGMITLKQSAILKVVDGLTSVTEILSGEII